MKDNDPSHDFLHVERVFKLAVHIGQEEAKKGVELNFEVIELGALLHDVEDAKYSKKPEGEARKLIHQLLDDEVKPEIVDKVVFIVENLSFRKELQNGALDLKNIPELGIVQDADRLEGVTKIHFSFISVP